MCLENRDALGTTKSKYMYGKYLDPTRPPRACDVSEVMNLQSKFGYCSVQMYNHLNFKYCTLIVSRTELRTDRWTDAPITRCPPSPDLSVSGRGHNYGAVKNIFLKGHKSGSQQYKINCIMCMINDHLACIREVLNPCMINDHLACIREVLNPFVPFYY